MLDVGPAELSALDLALVALAGIGAGVVNALAGGGTLLTFPTLTALGLPAVAANVTNTIALAPGHLGATLAQRRDLAGQRALVLRLVPAALLGGLAGGLLLLLLSERVFRQLVPWLILFAAALLAVQERVRTWLLRRLGAHPHRSHAAAAVPAVFAASIYGGYFGAGLSVIVLAVLGLLIDEPLTRLNATKQAIGFAANAAAAVLFLFSGEVHWPAAVVMAAGAVAGGALGGRLASRVRPTTLRLVVVAAGVVVGVAFLLKGPAQPHPPAPDPAGGYHRGHRSETRAGRRARNGGIRPGARDRRCRRGQGAVAAQDRRSRASSAGAGPAEERISRQRKSDSPVLTGT